MCASFVLFDSGNVVVIREDIVHLTTESHRANGRAALLARVMFHSTGCSFSLYIKHIQKAAFHSLINIHRA